MFTRPFPSFILCLLFAAPILSDRPPPPPTTHYDPFHAIAALAPKPSDEPICCLSLKPSTPLEPVDDDLFLSFEDWKAKRFSESSQKNNVPPNTSIPTTRESTEELPAHHASIAFDSAPDAMVDATLSEGSVGGSTTPIPPPPPPPPVSASPHFRVPLTDRFNYASLDCSARVHTAHGAAKSAASILSSQRDRYMLSPCGAKPQFVVVELCEDIRIDTVQLANFEFFSGVFREFTVSVAKTYAAADAEGWTVVGTYVGKNVRGVQSFHPPTSIRDFYRYIRIDFHSHYSNEYYCPISLLRVYGLTHLEQWKWDTWEEESRARQDLNAQVATAHVDIPHEPERPAETPQQVEEEPSIMAHDSSSPAAPSRDSTADLQDQRGESSRPLEGPDGHSTETTRSEPSTSSPISSIKSDSDSPIISTPSSASSDSVQAGIDNPTQHSHTSMSHDSNIASINTASPSSVFLSSRSANVSGTTSSTSRSSHSIATPASSPSVIIHASASHSPPPQVIPPLSPSPINVHSGESIYRTIMNRLSALEANTTLHARYVEEQTSAMREMLRRLSEDVGRLEGIGRAQAQMYARSISDFEKHRREMDIEQRTLISQVNYLAEEIVTEKRLGIAQLCLLLAVLVFLSVTRGSPGEFHVPRSSSSGSAVDASRIWARPNLRRLSVDWVSPSRLVRSASSGPARTASQDSQSHASTPMASTPVSRAWRWPTPSSSAFISPPPSSSTTNTTGPGGQLTKKAMAMMAASLSATPTPTFRQKRPPPLYLTPSQHHHNTQPQPHRVPRSRSTHAQVRTRPHTAGGGNTSPSPMRSLPKPTPVQRSSSYGGSFVGGGGGSTAAVPRSAKRWARTAHLHEVRRARHQHHHQYHHHNHNHQGVVKVSAAGEGGSGSENGTDVFVAAPSRGGEVHSAPVWGDFGMDGDASSSLMQMWMRTGTGKRTQQLPVGERRDGDGDGDGDEGGGGTDTWVDTDTDADADDDGAYGLWPGAGEVDLD